MFGHHDPLSSLSASSANGRSCGVASQSSAAMNSHMAAQYGSGLSSPPTGSSAASGAGLLGSGVGVPLQVPSQTPDLTSNYWHRLQ